MYADDLAHIHDRGFSHHAHGTAAGLLAALRRSGVREGLIVELGCGSGITAQALLAEGFTVFGIDQSRALLRRARKRAPNARFQQGSFFDLPIPDCSAVISLGECLGYRTEKRSGTRQMTHLLRRVRAALPPGGLLVFDLVTPAVARHAVNFRKGSDWALASENSRDDSGAWLRREITTFVRHGGTYRRGSETHWVQLYTAGEIGERLRKMGFSVRIRRKLGGYGLLPGRSLFIARRR